MAENFIEIIKEIRGSTTDPATDTSCIYGDIKQMHFEYGNFDQITQDERDKLAAIQENATANSTDEFLLNRSNHTGSQSADTITDGIAKVLMTSQERTKLSEIASGATANSDDSVLLNRENHTGAQSIDTINNSDTHVKMTVQERTKLETIQNRSNHSGTQSADTITDGSINAAYTLVEKAKLSTLNQNIGNENITDVNWNKLQGVPTTFAPSAHQHAMSDITTGNLSASRINETIDLQFVDSSEKARIADAEILSNKGVPYGYVPLDGNGKINASYLNNLNIQEVFTPENEASMLLLTNAEPGDIAYRQDTEDSYMLVALPSNLLANWKKLNVGANIVSVNGQTGVIVLSTDNIDEGSTNLYYTNERVDDRVNSLLKAGTNVSISYDDALNELTISANDTSVNWSEIQNKPDPTITVNISGDISGSGSVTLTDVSDGTLTIDNMTLENIGTAGTYRSVTTDSNGRVTSGTNPTTVNEYGLTDVYTKTEVQESLPAIGLDTTNTTAPTRVGQIKWNQDDATADLRLLNGVTLQIGQENNRNVRASTAVTNGRLCMFDGTIGNSGKVKVKHFTGGFNEHSMVYGVATQNINAGADGYITISGKVREIDTTGAPYGETWNDEDIIYAKPNDAGALTNVEPGDDELKMIVATVVHAHSNGTLELRVLPFNENMIAKRANKLTTARAISITGDASGSANFDGSSNIDINISIANDSHTHSFANITSKPTTIDGYGIEDAYTSAEINSTNIFRSDRFLSSQNVANTFYNIDRKLIKVQYNNATDVNYEVLTYNLDKKLSNVAHYTESVLRGNTVLSYSDGKLVSAIYTEV